MNTRIRRLGVALVVLYLLLFAQLNRVQFFGAERLQENVNNSRGLVREFGRARGQILTADGVVVARSVEVGEPVDYRREYPEGELYAHVAGYQSLNVASTGLEREYNDELAGTPIEQQFQSFGDLFSSRDTTATLRLTIRHDVQEAAREALGDRRGSVVALDPRSGEIVSMWTWPSFDPNLIADPDGAAANGAYEALLADPDDPLLGKAFREVFFPGSTFKLVTAAAGVENGLVGAFDPVFEATDAYEPIPAGFPIGNFGGSTCGGDLMEVLRVSCNTAFAEMGAEWVGPDAMITAAEAFGFNHVPPIDLPSAARSRFPTDFGDYLADVAFYRYSDADEDAGGVSAGSDAAASDESATAPATPGDDTATPGDDTATPGDNTAPANSNVSVHEDSARLAQASIGQNDVSATPLQMALVAAAIANDGVVMAPHVVRTLTAADGSIYDEIEPDVWRVAMSAGTARVLFDAMVNVAENGTARNLAVEGLVVGGKTGTAQLGTEPPNSHAWIVGFAGPPGSPPELAVAVIVEAQEGASEQTGGRVAAPVARAVIEAYFAAG